MQAPFDLIHGLKLGSGAEAQLHITVTLRELSTGDIMDARMASEQLRMTVENGKPKSVLVVSEEMQGLEMLRRQIASIGDIQGPIDMKILRKLHIDDFALITHKAADIDAVAIDTATARGRLGGAGSDT